MAGDDKSPASGRRRKGAAPDRFRDATASRLADDKTSHSDPAAASLGARSETADRPAQPRQSKAAFRSPAPGVRERPLSPNIQIYRPQITSVLSIGNRITGVLLGIGGVGLVVWLSAGALGPAAYAGVTAALLSIPGQVVLFLFTLAFFFHLCAGVRHLMWDTVHGFELRTVYISGWIVVMASLALTVIAWAVGLFVMS